MIPDLRHPPVLYYPRASRARRILSALRLYLADVLDGWATALRRPDDRATAGPTARYIMIDDRRCFMVDNLPDIFPPSEGGASGEVP